mmetsp:Transcript_3376/g.8445  ORF Transcript_3376/g.8445 Transcript_3376/m.8445 type:complete len:339 (+) Transcript_3376:315-1331(+)
MEWVRRATHSRRPRHSHISHSPGAGRAGRARRARAGHYPLTTTSLRSACVCRDGLSRPRAALFRPSVREPVALAPPFRPRSCSRDRTPSPPLPPPPGVVRFPARHALPHSAALRAGRALLRRPWLAAALRPPLQPLRERATLCHPRSRRIRPEQSAAVRVLRRRGVLRLGYGRLVDVLQVRGGRPLLHREDVHQRLDADERLRGVRLRRDRRVLPRHVQPGELDRQPAVLEAVGVPQVRGVRGAQRLLQDVAQHEQWRHLGSAAAPPAPPGGEHLHHWPFTRRGGGRGLRPRPEHLVQLAGAEHRGRVHLRAASPRQRGVRGVLRAAHPHELADDTLA